MKMIVAWVVARCGMCMEEEEGCRGFLVRKKKWGWARLRVEIVMGS